MKRKQTESQLVTVQGAITKSTDQAIVKRTKLDDRVVNHISNTIPIHRGKFKSRYLHKHSFLVRRADPATGILISCATSTETRAFGQIRTFMDRIMPELFPDIHSVYPNLPAPAEINMQYVVDDQGRPVVTATKSCTPEPTQFNDIDSSLLISQSNSGLIDDVSVNQMSTLSTTTRNDKKQPLFQMYDSGCAGLLFLRFRNSVSPTKAVLDIFEHIASSPNKKLIQARDLSHCRRFLPIQQVCSAASLHDIITAFGPAVNTVDTLGKSVAIVIESRNAPAIERKSLITELAACFPPNMTVNLTHPDVIVLVSIFKSVAGLCIIKGDEYRKTHHFNIQQL